MPAQRIFQRLTDLLDVHVTSVQDGDVVAYDSGEGKFTNQAGGSYSPPTTRGQYTQSGVGVSIANNASDYLEWQFLGTGTQLLDLTDKKNPTVLESGIYAVSASVIPVDNMTVDGHFKAVLALDFDGEDAEADADSRLATAAQPTPEAHAALTYYIPAGHIIRVRVQNRDGASPIHFGLDVACVQRLT